MSTAPISYKETLHLPQTSFPMKGDLPVREPKILSYWSEKQIFNRLIESRKAAGAKQYVFPDGPPYANGNLHMGHALNKILKDIVTKYKNLSGYYAEYIPGWDCHGLPIEQKVTKALGAAAREKTAAEIRKLCREEALKWVQAQGEQFQRMGVFGKWDQPYLTMDASYEAEEVRVLARVLRSGAFYRGEKPVYWCPVLQTALADTEVEYQEQTSPSIYVRFEMSPALVSCFGVASETAADAVIWTTTPWTLPANLAISVHPDFEYQLFKVDGQDRPILIAKEMKSSVEKITSLVLTPIGTAVVGHKLENQQTRHPFIDRASPILLGTHVTLEAGTGCVHTAPGHGQDDYIVGQKYGLPPYSPVDGAGKFTAEVPEYQGQKIFDVNPQIVDRLKTSNRLLFGTTLRHSYPHNWRTKTPLIFRATPQWFMSMDNESEVRKKTLKAIRTVQWIPSWGENRITSMIENRPDWCLSRQRLWGVPIVVFFCNQCETELLSADLMDNVADQMEKESGKYGSAIEVYHQKSVQDLIGPQVCEKCGHNEFKKGQDILDVWFDSGIYFSAVQKHRLKSEEPADLYLEGSDQHRGWFHTSLLASIATTGRAPYKTVLTHGFVMFAKGQKMSKSLGNVVDPQDLISKNGADILRLWAAHEDYSNDLTCSPESFERVMETYRRLRNTMRFMLGNLNDFNPSKDLVKTDKLSSGLDRWLLCRLHQLIEETQKAYDQFQFHKIYHLLNQFATVELSAIYFDVVKDRLYTGKKNGENRRSAQTVLYLALQTFMGLAAPILSFLSEESFQSQPWEHEDSIFLKEFPSNKSDELVLDQNLLKEFQFLLSVRSDVQKKLEQMRQSKDLGSSLEAAVVLSATGDQFQVLKKYQEELSHLFIVSDVQLNQGFIETNKVPSSDQDQVKGQISLMVQKASGKKCARCWSIRPETGQNTQFPDACSKCIEALS